VSYQLQSVSLVHPNGQRALSGVSLAARRGERIAVIGSSGAGKTTLLRLLASALRPTDGRLEVLDVGPWQLSAGKLRRLRSRIGMVYQAPPLPPRQRVITAILAGRLGVWPWWRSLLSLVYPADIGGARDELARLDLADRLFDRCDRLSGGQLQRVGVARVLYQKPELMLADEPVSSMDPALADHTINQLVTEATTRGVTLVASLHAVDLALRWFPRIVGLKEGEIVFDLPPVRVTEQVLRDLYASENGPLPLHGDEPFVLPTPALGRDAGRRKSSCS
jgi:phosphonate transport system ATP-binding protein